MSDLWDRCRVELRRCMSDQEWRRSIEPLRAWIDIGTLYLWVDRASDDWRSIPNPARGCDASIRKTARETWGRELASIRYLDRPPRREQIINERRVVEHRKKVRGQEDDKHRRLIDLAKEECLRLVDDAAGLRLTGSEEEIQRKLLAIVMDRAKQRLEKEKLRTGAVVRRGGPPELPPPHR